MRNLNHRIAKLEQHARVAEDECLVLVVVPAGARVGTDADMEREIEVRRRPGQKSMLIVTPARPVEVGGRSQ